MIRVDFEDLSAAFEFAGSTPLGENNAYVCRDTGQIHLTSEMDLVEVEVPDDLETSDRYVLLPHKTELDLGRGLALRFAARDLPDRHEQIADCFRRKGAFARFKEILDSEGALQRWYQYEAAATETALRRWCAENDIQLTGS